MLNEIHLLGKGLEIEDENGLHFRIKKTINNGVKVRLHLIPYGDKFKLEVLTNESCEKIKIVWCNKNNYLFSIKLPSKDFRSANYALFRKKVKENIKLWDELTSIPEIKDLRDQFEKLDTDKILDKILDFKIEKDIYVIFDLTLIRSDIYQRISEVLYSQVSVGERKDIFGNQLEKNSKDGQMEFMLHEGKKPEKILLKVYSCDENVKCYSRYGIKDKAVSATSYARVHKILTRLAKESCIRTVRVQTSYIGDGRKSDNKEIKYRFVCNLKEFTASIEQYSKWNPQELIDALLHQKKLKRNVNLLVYRENGNFPQSLVFQECFDPEDLKSLITKWVAGCDNVVNYQYVYKVNVRNLFDYLSQSFFISSAKLCSRFNHKWKLEDSFLFLENKPMAIEKALRLFVRDLPYFSAGCDEQDNASKNKFFMRESVCGLILDKKGIDMTSPEIENHYAYLLGRLFNIADWAQREYFTKRDKLCPSPLLGAQKLNACYTNKNSHRALVDVDRKIAPYLAWAASKNGSIPAKYREIRSKINVEELPKSLSVEDMAIMGMGYWKREKSEAKKEMETV